jgi:amino acid transporter
MSDTAGFGEMLDNIVMAVILCIGLIYFMFATVVFGDLQPKCTEPILGTGWTAIQVMGIIMFGVGLSYFLCTLSRGSCYISGRGVSLKTYAIIFFLVNSVTLIFSAMMYSKYKKFNDTEKELCGATDGKHQTYIVFVLMISVISIIGSIYIISTSIIEANKSVEQQELLNTASTSSTSYSDIPQQV